VILGSAPALRRLARDGGQLACDSIAAALDGRGEHQAGDRVAIRQQGLDQRLQVGHVRGGHLEQKVVASGQMVALADLFEGLDEIQQPMVLVSAAAHANKGHHLQAQRFVVDFDGVAVQNPGLFHLLEALGGRGGREADAAAQFGQTEARIGLQFVKKLSSVAIE